MKTHKKGRGSKLLWLNETKKNTIKQSGTLTQQQLQEDKGNMETRVKGKMEDLIKNFTKDKT